MAHGLWTCSSKVCTDFVSKIIIERLTTRGLQAVELALMPWYRLYCVTLRRTITSKKWLCESIRFASVMRATYSAHKQSTDECDHHFLHAAALSVSVSKIRIVDYKIDNIANLKLVPMIDISQNRSSPGILPPLDLPLVHCVEQITIGLFYCTFIFSNKRFYRGISGFATDWWCLVSWMKHLPLACRNVLHFGNFKWVGF